MSGHTPWSEIKHKSVRRKRVLLILSHSIEEYDQLRLLDSLGYDVFSLGGYIDPEHPHVDMRPALPNVPHWARLHEAVDALGTDDNIGNAAKHIPDTILDWLGDDGVIICHHYLERLFGQWDHLREWGGRIVWRTVGQSTTDNELRAQEFRRDGLEIVRYSPKEANIPGYAGADALIRFYKDETEWSGWTGEFELVANITQALERRDPWTNAGFYLAATEGLRAAPAGPESETLPGGMGLLSQRDMKQYLREARAYIYCGTQPASYTLGLIEAMMTGTPVVSIGPAHMQIFPYGHKLYEGHELAEVWSNDPYAVKIALQELLQDHDYARQRSDQVRAKAIATWGMDTIGVQWKAYLA